MDDPFTFLSDIPEPKSTGKLTVIIDDCVKTMTRFKDEGTMFDAIVVDPPYAISLHGYGWDTEDLVMSKQFWELAYSVMKPGAFLLSFAASRKYHQVASAIDGAGFTMYPMLQWTFSTGLPKPSNLSELFDRDNVKDRKILGTKTGSGFTTANELHGAQQRLTKEFAMKERGVSDEAKAWDGFYYGVNTMKPSFEPIVMAQKPISEKRMIDNVRKHGTGALNIGALKERLNGSWPTPVFDFPKVSVRDHGSNHPSVKPIDLMRQLCILACPPNGHILDPFAGTGTTGAGAIREGFDCTVIEMNPEMETVIAARMRHKR